MYLIEDEKGKKPGLVKIRKNEKGSRFIVEIWELPLKHIGKLLNSAKGSLPRLVFRTVRETFTSHGSSRVNRLRC